LDFGTVRAAPTDTYVAPSREDPAAANAAGLVRSLSNFGDSLGQYAATERARKEQTDRLKLDGWVAQAEKEGRLGTADLVYAGKLAANSSFQTQSTLTERLGERNYEKQYSETVPKIIADQSYTTDPTKLKGWYDTERDRILKETDGREFYQSGAISALNKVYNGLKTRLETGQANELTEAGKEAFNSSANTAVMAAQNTVMKAARELGIDPKYVMPILRQENPAGDPNAKNPIPGQTASGLMQITDGTWATLVKTPLGQKYGLTMENKNDPEKNALGGAILARVNYEMIQEYKGDVTPGDVKAAHFLGMGGYRNVLENARENGSKPIKEVVSATAYANNKSMFKDKDGNDLTVSGFINKMNSTASAGDITTMKAKRYDGTQSFEMNQNSFNSKHYIWTDFKNNGVPGGDGKFDGRLINMLDAVTDQFGKGKLTLTSGFRNKDYNAKQSFSTDSEHTHGDALDIDVSKYNDADKAKLIALFTANGARGIGHYDNGTIHVDLAVGRGAGKQADGMALWYEKNQPYESGKSWFKEGLDQGRKWREDGNVPTPGFNGQPLNAFDAKVKEGPRYGMSERTARDELFNTITNQALALRNPGLLDNIPLNSITADQQAKVMTLRTQIGQLIRTESVQKLEDANRREAKAVEARQSEVVEKFLKGEAIDLNEASKVTYKDENGQDKTVAKPGLLQYATQLKQNPLNDPAKSLANAMEIGEKLQNATITGKFEDVFKDDPVYGPLVSGNRTPSDSEWMQAIAADNRMDSAEKMTLIGKVPGFKDYYKIINDQATKDTYNYLDTEVRMWMQSDSMTKLLASVNPTVREQYIRIPSMVKSAYDKDYANAYKAEAADNGGKVSETRKIELREKSLEKATKLFEKLSSGISASGKAAQDTATPVETPFKEGDTVTGTDMGGKSAVSGKITGVYATTVGIMGPDGDIILVPKASLKQEGADAGAQPASPMPPESQAAATQNPNALKVFRPKLDPPTEAAQLYADADGRQRQGMAAIGSLFNTNDPNEVRKNIVTWAQTYPTLVRTARQEIYKLDPVYETLSSNLAAAGEVVNNAKSNEMKAARTKYRAAESALKAREAEINDWLSQK
jgi:uncharacterized protein YcbK (DUF882 family)